MIAKKTVLRNIGTWLETTLADYDIEDVRRVEGDVLLAIESGHVGRTGTEVIYAGAGSDLVSVEADDGDALTRVIPVTVSVVMPTLGRLDHVETMETLDDIEDTLLVALIDVYPAVTFGTGVAKAVVRESGAIIGMDPAIAGRYVYLELHRMT